MGWRNEMRRRGVLAAMAMLPASAAAQPAQRRYRVAYLSGGSNESRRPYLEILLEALASYGYQRDRNLDFFARGADGRFDLLPALAADIVALNPDVIVASSSAGVLATKAATTRIPIVMTTTGDPVGIGAVASLARPDGNVTGFTSASVEVVGKRLQLLKQLLPRAGRIAVVFSADERIVSRFMASARAAAETLDMELAPLLPVRGAGDLDAAFAQVAAGADGALRFPDALTAMVRPAIQQAALRHRVPVSFAFREDVVLGGLISYGANQAQIYRQAARTVHRLLQGAKPADLPVEMPTQFDLVINTGTAKTLGIKVPPTLLAGATDLIE